MAAFSSLLVVLCIFHHVASEMYYIKPSEEHICPLKPCLTLSQLAMNSSVYLMASSVITIAPGNHRLHTKLTVSNMDNFTMFSNSSLTTPIIECNLAGNLSFESVKYTIVKNLKFIGCVQNIQSVEKFILQNSTFESHGFHGAAIQLIETSAIIDGSSFMSKQADSVQGLNISNNKSDSLAAMGAILGIHSNITITGYTIFSNCSALAQNSPPGQLLRGGAITLFHSHILFIGVCEMKHNYAENGGAILATQSKACIKGELSVINNGADYNGGGIYLYQSELNLDKKGILRLKNNHAARNGGGINAVSSSIRVTVETMFPNNHSVAPKGGKVIFSENRAAKGGGISLKAGSKLYVMEYLYGSDTINKSDGCMFANAISFRSNSADYGGAVYVDEPDTNPESCDETFFDTDFQKQCFFQLVNLQSFMEQRFCTIYLHFSNNSAQTAGPILFGGQLNSCITSPFSRVIDHSSHPSLSKSEGFPFLKKVSNDLDEELISSRPLQLCHCVNGYPNCSYEYQHSIEVHKGEVFTVQLAAVDQVGHPVNGTIHGRLKSYESELVRGQSTQIISACFNATFSILSHIDSETLTLYTPTSPCKVLSLDIQFSPCTCPLGFQPLNINADKCVCQCHSDISQYVECNSTIKSFNRLSNVWIRDVTYGTNNNTGYLVFQHCPFDYCKDIGRDVYVNLNLPSGIDAQCAFNRTGLLCGSCPPGLSLSLGSSRCFSCPDYWPVLFISITLAAILAGVALVALILFFNMTVAVGTLNALIFYANIVATHRSILLPFPEPNFVTIFISWLNLELGIDSCYFQGMDAYTKTWLQLVFPTYIIILVVIVIVICTYSSKFSQLMGKKNPLATMATLVLISYAKFLQTVIAIMVFGILHYPNGSHEVVWLHDAAVKYFVGKHSALFLLAIFILIIGIIYTTLLLFWQCLLRSSRRSILRWVDNVKLHALMEAYHAPFTSKYRFWPGLLLLVRACLCLVDALNTSNNPQVAFTSITFTLGSIIILKGFIGSRIHKRWTFDVLEMGVLFNLLFFTTFMWYTFDTDGSQEAIAYISVSITFILLLLIIMYHVYAYTGLSLKLHQTIPTLKTQDSHTNDVSTDTYDANYELSSPSEPTHSVVESPIPYREPYLSSY